MQQSVKIIDPNFTKYFDTQNFDEDIYAEHGRRMLSFLKSSGVEKEVRDDFRVFLAKNVDVLKKTKDLSKLKLPPNYMKEMTRHGHPSFAMSFGAETLGVYNPDIIPIDTYNRMKTDPQVAIGISVIKMPIESLNWHVECDDKDIREFVKVALTKVWRKLIRSMLTAVDYGFCSHEVIWELQEMMVVSQLPTGRRKTHFKGPAEIFKKIKAHYPATIRVRKDALTDEFLGIVQIAAGGSPVSLDADKCFFFALNDEFGNYFGTSRLKAAYKPWYWREVLTQFMLRYFERKGGPTTVIQHPTGGGIDREGNEYDNSEIALRIGQNIVENGVVTVPFEADREGKNQWGVTYLQDDRRGEMFVNALNYLGAQILRGLLTPERVMTQDLSTGSFSMAQSHAEIFLLAEEGLAAEMCDAVNLILVPQLVQFNFPANKIIPCQVKIEKIQYDRRRILKEILIEVLRNINTFMKGGKMPLILPSIQEMSDILGVPLVAAEEEYYDTGEVDPTAVGTDGVGGNPANPPKPKGKEAIKPEPKKEVKRAPLKVVKK
jgi:hypothetical protein